MSQQGSSAIPMNMGDWQNQLRAQKDAERKQKMEAAEILRKHNAGVNEEELKLSAMRAEDRKKQMDAEQNLHNYRSNDPVEVKARPTRQDVAYPAPEVIHKEDNLPTPGSVSAMAGKFSKGPEEQDPVTGTPLKMGGSSEEKKTEEEPTVDVPHELKEDEPLHGHPTIVRLDVLFSFGLVTSSVKPVFNGYLQAVEEIVQATLEKNTELLEHCTYDPMFGPYVKDCIPDETFTDSAGRAGVKRFVATIAVPVFLGSGISINHARDGVITGLQDAIQSGRFLTLAQTN